jgi:hypothetical protein
MYRARGSPQRVWRGDVPSNKTILKSVTPDSVKALMVIEAIMIGFFSFWLANEYVYNVYFRIYIDSVFVQHLTSYTIAIGLGIGLAGTAVAAALYKTMRETKVKLESVAPKIRGSVEKLLTSVPTIDAKGSPASTGPVAAVVQSELSRTTSATVVPVSSPKPPEEK